MGKGDKKSRRGKIHIGSHGTRRPRKNKNSVPGTAVPKVIEKAVKPVEEVVKKAAKTAPVKPVVEPIVEPVAEPVAKPAVKPAVVKGTPKVEVAEVKKAPRKTTKKVKD